MRGKIPRDGTYITVTIITVSVRPIARTNFAFAFVWGKAMCLLHLLAVEDKSLVSLTGNLNVWCTHLHIGKVRAEAVKQLRGHS